MSFLNPLPPTRNLDGSLNACYIICPIGVNLAPLKKTLSKYGFKLITVSEIIPSSVPLMESVYKNISRSSLIIAILETRVRNEPIFLELGIAAALNKKILIIVKPPMEVPDELKSFPYLRLDPENSEHLDYIINEITMRYQRKKQKSIGSKKARPSKEGAYSVATKSKVESYKSIDLTSKWKILSKTDVSEIQLINLVISILLKSGISIFRTSTRNESADIAVWSDEWQQSIGNPLLIEVKKKIPKTRNSREIIDQFKEKSAGLIDPRHWILVLYLHGPSSSELARPYRYPVLFLKLEELIVRIRETSFVNIVRELRNKAVHGV